MDKEDMWIVKIVFKMNYWTAHGDIVMVSGKILRKNYCQDMMVAHSLWNRQLLERSWYFTVV